MPLKPPSNAMTKMIRMMVPIDIANLLPPSREVVVHRLTFDGATCRKCESSWTGSPQDRGGQRNLLHIPEPDYVRTIEGRGEPCQHRSSFRSRTVSVARRPRVVSNRGLAVPPPISL